MSENSPIDEAYRRCRILSEMLKEYRKQIRSKPNDNRWVELGIVDEGEKSADANRKINQTFDLLANLIAHITVLDMAAALEKASQARLGTAIGAVRKARSDADKKYGLPAYSQNLIYGTDQFDSLGAVASLLENHLDKELKDGFKAVRDARNIYAHGTNVRIPPTIDADSARKILNGIYDSLK